MHAFSLTVIGKYLKFIMIGLINVETEQFIFVGEEGSCLFYEANDVAYGTSDESGPDIMNSINDNPDYFEITTSVETYFNECALNRYH